MAAIILIEGPVGAGKSTFARELSRKIKAPHLNLDAWMSKLFSLDRPATGRIEWYVERKQRCIEMIWLVAQQILDANSDVILELGLIQRDSRNAFYQQVDPTQHNLKVYVLDEAREVRRERVRQRNIEQGETFSMVVPDDIFEMSSDLWQEPDVLEIEDRQIEFVESEFT